LGSDSVQVRVTEVDEVEVALVNTGVAGCASAFCKPATRTHREIVSGAIARWIVPHAFAENDLISPRKKRARDRITAFPIIRPFQKFIKPSAFLFEQLLVD